jgi:hypothetical protein
MQPPGAAIPYNVGRRAAIGVQKRPEFARDVQHATRRSGASTPTRAASPRNRFESGPVMGADAVDRKHAAEDENRKIPWTLPGA